MRHINWQGHRWMMWLGLAVLGLEALVVALCGGLLALFVFLIIDGSGTFVGMWMAKKWCGQETQRHEDDSKMVVEDDAKTLEVLRHAGFTSSESERLYLLRKHYTKQGDEQACEDLSRLKFVRWLVATGKLREDL